MVNLFRASCIAAALAALILNGGRAAAPAPLNDPAEFLQQHREPLEGGVDAGGARLILLGEVHGVAATNPLDLALLEDLNRRAGVRTYLAEISSSHAEYINRYLDAGDPQWLDLVFAAMRGHTVDCSEEKRRFWVALRDWNGRLPVVRRIRVMGVDLERWPGISLALLQERLPGDRRVAEARSHPTDAAIRALVASLERGAGGEASRPDVRQACEDLAARCACDEDRAHYDQRRDDYMTAALMRQAASLPAGPIYGRLGFAHVLQHRFEHVLWLSGQLEKHSDWAGRIISIWPLYDQCERLELSPGHAAAVPCASDPAQLAPFAAAAPGDARATLFRLSGSDSPFSRLLGVPGGGEGGVTADYVQYVALLRHSMADTPLR